MWPPRGPLLKVVGQWLCEPPCFAQVSLLAVASGVVMERGPQHTNCAARVMSHGWSPFTSDLCMSVLLWMTSLRQRRKLPAGAGI